RQKRRSAAAAPGDEVADADLVPADAAVDGRSDAGEFEIELGVLHRGPGGVERSRGLAHLLETLVEDALGGEVALTQLGGALHLALRQLEPRLGLRDLGARRGERVLERARVDDEEKVALPN